MGALTMQRFWVFRERMRRTPDGTLTSPVAEPILDSMFGMIPFSREHIPSANLVNWGNLWITVQLPMVPKDVSI